MVTSPKKLANGESFSAGDKQEWKNTLRNCVKGSSSILKTKMTKIRKQGTLCADQKKPFLDGAPKNHRKFLIANWESRLEINYLHYNTRQLKGVNWAWVDGNRDNDWYANSWYFNYQFLWTNAAEINGQMRFFFLDFCTLHISKRNKILFNFILNNTL